MATITVAGETIEAPNDLLNEAGFVVFTGGGAREDRIGAVRDVMIAMSEGHHGVAAVLRAVAIYDQRCDDSNRLKAVAAANESALRAAQLRLEAAKLEAQAKS